MKHEELGLELQRIEDELNELADLAEDPEDVRKVCELQDELKALETSLRIIEDMGS